MAWMAAPNTAAETVDRNAAVQGGPAGALSLYSLAAVDAASDRCDREHEPGNDRDQDAEARPYGGGDEVLRVLVGPDQQAWADTGPIQRHEVRRFHGLRTAHVDWSLGIVEERIEQVPGAVLGAGRTVARVGELDVGSIGEPRQYWFHQWRAE